LGVERDGLGAPKGRIVEPAGERSPVGAGDAGQLEDPEVEADLQEVSIFARTALLRLVEDPVAKVGAVDLGNERCAVRGLGGDESRALAASVARAVEKAAEGNGLGL